LDDEEMLSDDASSEEDEIINDVDVFSDDEDEEARQKKKKTIKDMVAKLDVILNTVLEHFNKLEEGSSSSSSANSSSTTLTNSSSFATSLASSATLPSTPFTFPAPSIPTLTTNNLSSASLLALRTSQFSTLLSIFDRLILKTFKSRYTQFLLFYYTSLSPTFTDEFQSLLLSKALFERDQPDIARIAAASYIASFVSRARWVPKETVRNVMGLLCKYLEAQLEAARMKPEILRGVGSACSLRWRRRCS
jgi:RNA polymerase I-specific transcription initiation factor RRN3